jgi:hypothetical protein
MSHQPRESDHKEYPELELALKLSQLEGTFQFLDYMNNGKTVTGEDFPRNTTERSSVDRGLKRVQECRQLFKEILNKNRLHEQEVS